MERGGSSNSQPKRGVQRSVAGAAGSFNNGGGGGGGSGGGPRRDPDHYMPIGNVTRIMRRVLPDNAKVSDDAKEAMQECVAEFISHLTRAANDLCHRDYRRTITPDDAVAAMAALGFHDYVGPLSVFLNKHRAAQDPHHYYIPPPMTPPTVALPSPPPPQFPMTPPSSPVVGGYVPSPPPHQFPPMTPPSSPAVGGYVPSPPEEYVELPVVRDYFAEYPSGGGGGGEGYSGDGDFDPFE